MIIEVEAYDGERDLACHARVGPTGRTAVMYGPGGFWYVYLCYGVHEMLNLVVGPPGWPAAVLIRGIEGCSGPGRLTRLLGIDRRLNREPASRTSGLWIEDRGVRVPSRLIEAGPRRGVRAGPAHTRAGPVESRTVRWADTWSTRGAGAFDVKRPMSSSVAPSGATSRSTMVP